MTNQEAIKRIEEHIAIHKYMELQAIHIVEALEMAISALKAQEIHDLLLVSPLLDKKKKKRKREAISAHQPQELSKNSSKLDKENGDLQPICNNLATDTISRNELPSAELEQKKGIHEITESDKISYAVICDKFPSPHVYFNTYDEAKLWARIDQPNYRPYYIIERSEHFEIVGEVR